MDMTDTIKATRIGLGVESGRKLLGLYWFTPNGLTAHTSLRCSHSSVDAATALRLPVFTEDGVMRVLKNEEALEVAHCNLCPPAGGDESWREWAACIGNDGAFAETRKERGVFIENNCNQCAVQLECLDYGEQGGNDNAGMVWGGIYFITGVTERRKNIADQRRRIESGEFG